MSAALRVFLFSAAFPFFSNVDEREHFDLVVKYSRGQVPHHLLPYSEESAVYFVQYGSPEFFYTPQHYPEREFPAPFWTFPVEETVGPLQTRTAAWVSRINHEASEPPLYYAMAGIWMRVGDWLGLNGGFLLYWIRFLNMFLAAALVCLGAWVVRSLFPERGFVQLGVILLLAFYPQDTFYSIESDVLSPLLFGLVFLAMRPLGQVTQVAQQHVRQECGPHLPAHRVGVVSQEIGQLQGLLDLLEENLNLPPAPVEIGHTARTPLQIVGQKSHLPLLPVHFHDSHDPAHQLRRGLVGVAQHDDFIGKNLRVPGLRHLLDHFVSHVVFGAGDPEHAALIQILQVPEIHVPLVKQHDFAALDPGAQFPRPFVVVLAGGVDNHKVGQQTLQVEPHVCFGRRLAPQVVGPVHAVGHQFHDRGVHHVNRHLETKGWPSAPSCGKSRRLLTQVTHHPPKELLGHLGWALSVGVRKSVAARRRCPTNAGQRPRVQLQRITQIIQADAMAQLPVEQAHDMAPGVERPRLILRSRDPGNLGYFMHRNVIANLPQDVDLGAGWNPFELIHPCRVAGANKKFQPIFSNPVRWL